MSEIKRSLMNLSFYDQKGIEDKLEKMAARGWMLEKPGTVFWTYRKIPPQSLRFAVTYFPSATQFDPGPSEAQLTKEEFCAWDGWRLVARWDAMQIFCTAQEDPVPIETDPVTQVENIRRTMKKRVLPSQLAMAAVMVYWLVFQLTQLREDPVSYLSSNFQLLSLPVWAILLLASLREIVFCFCWYRKARRAAENGVFLLVRSRTASSWLLLGAAVLLLLLAVVGSNMAPPAVLLWLLTLAAILLAARGVTGILRKAGAASLLNRVLTGLTAGVLTLVCIGGIVVVVLAGGFYRSGESTPVGSYEWNGHVREIYDDPLPLEVEELRDADLQWTKEADRQESFLLSRTEYSQSPLLTEEASGYDLDYEVVDVKAPFLYEFVKEGILSRRQDEIYDGFVFTDHYEPVDPTPWNAREVYQLHWSGSVMDTYLVCWEGRIVEIRFYWPPTSEQIRRAAEILAPEGA